MHSVASPELHVLIVGAGPTGLVLACLCRRLGLEVRVIDKQPGPSTTSKAIGLQYRVSELLAAMGVVDRFLARGSSPTPVNIYEGARRLVRFDFNLVDAECGRGAFAPRPIMIPQSETEQILGERLAELGVEVEWNTEFVERLENDTCVVSRIRRADGGEERVVSAWLVSSEGAHSVIRKQAGIEFQGKTYPLAFFLADVELDTDLEHNGNHVWMHPDGAFAALPLPPPRVWRLFVEISSQREKYPGEPTEGDIAELMSERMGLDPRCIQRYLWLSQFRINCRMVRQYRQGRTFLAGDAAHIHSPTGGQGITTCVQDAVNLAWKLARVVHGAPDALLDTYQQERLPHAEEVLRETDRTTTVFFSRNPAVRLLRNWVVLPVLRTRFVQKRMFGKLAQLHVNYRHSPLSRTDAAWRSRPRRQGGDRAPDVALMRANSGESVTLFELLHAARPVALIGADRFDADALSSRAALIEALRMLDIDAYVVSPSSKSRDEATETPLLCDAEGELRRIYGLEGDFFCLIRPDGHLGLVQRPLDVGLLKDYLRMLCAAEAIEAAFGGRPSADFRLPIADFRLQVVDGGCVTRWAMPQSPS